MDIINITGIQTAAFSSTGAFSVLFPLFIFIFGITLYSIFVFSFYRFLARENIFHLNLSRHSESLSGLIKHFSKVLFYILEYLFIFPLFILFWAGVLSLMIFLMDPGQHIQNVLFISMAFVASVRITAYYNEQLSQDLAKLLPFTFLVILLIDISSFSATDTLASFRMIPLVWKHFIYYFIFIVCLEFLLRIITGIYHFYHPPALLKKKV